MQSLLNHPRHPDHSAIQHHLVRHGEIIAHNAVLGVYTEMRSVLPNDYRDLALPIALVGAITGLGRLLAACDDQRHARKLARGVSDILQNEISYWRNTRLPY